MKIKHWMWVGGAFLAGALVGAYTGLPLTPFNLQLGMPVGRPATPAAG